MTFESPHTAWPPALLGEPGAVRPSTEAGALWLAGVTMHAVGAWDVINATALWVASARRGTNILIPGASGRRRTPRRKDQNTVNLKMVIGGVFDVNGIHWRENGYQSVWDGLERNVAYLDENVWTPPDPPVTFITANLVMPSGSIRTGPVSIDSVEVGENTGPVVKAVMAVTVAAGALV